jgi:zinc transporter ZupT
MADVAILMKNNFDGLQTILCNIFVNITSLIGGVVGMALGSISEATQLYILAFVAGNFMYIAADIWRNLLKNKSACANILEFCSFIVGVGAMYLVLLAESGGEHEH